METYSFYYFYIRLRCRSKRTIAKARGNVVSILVFIQGIVQNKVWWTCSLDLHCSVFFENITTRLKSIRFKKLKCYTNCY